MNDIMRDISSVAMAIIGVAILAVIVSNSNNTTGVIQAATSGFGNVLGIAMGGAGGHPGTVGG